MPDQGTCVVNIYLQVTQEKDYRFGVWGLEFLQHEMTAQTLNGIYPALPFLTHGVRPFPEWMEKGGSLAK